MTTQTTATEATATTTTIASFTGKEWNEAIMMLAQDFSDKGHAFKAEYIPQDLQIPYFRANKIVKHQIINYDGMKQNNRDEFKQVVSFALVEIATEIKDFPQNDIVDNKTLYRLVNRTVARLLRQTFKTELNQVKSRRVMDTLSLQYKLIKEEQGIETAKTFWSSFSSNYQKAYQNVVISYDELEMIESAVSVEQEAIKSITLDMLEASDKLTRVERETLEAIRYGTFETGRGGELGHNQVKLDRLIKKARTLLA